MRLGLTILTRSPEETQEVGKAIGAQCQPGHIYLLAGPLGAGKTCLTQGIAQGLVVPGRVRSPTFVLVGNHRGRLVLHHLDLYRISGPQEAWDLGVDEELFGAGVCVVEWADRAAELFPEDSCWVTLDYGPGENDRTMVFSADSPRYRPLLRFLAEAFPVVEEANS
jgi:tRNA threonylcarbamoyladenosine biosynthesis protein TsaE